MEGLFTSLASLCRKTWSHSARSDYTASRHSHRRGAAGMATLATAHGSPLPTAARAQAAKTPLMAFCQVSLRVVTVTNALR